MRKEQQRTFISWVPYIKALPPSLTALSIIAVDEWNLIIIFLIALQYKPIPIRNESADFFYKCSVILLLLHCYLSMMFHFVCSVEAVVLDLCQQVPSCWGNSRVEYLQSQTLGRRYMYHSLQLLTTKILAATALRFAVKAEHHTSPYKLHKRIIWYSRSMRTGSQKNEKCDIKTQEE